MAQVKDPVCGMIIDSDSAAATAQHGGATVYFCSTGCKHQFEGDRDRYSAGAAPFADRAAPREELERHESPFTTKDGMTSPKFGSAGSGGAEYERLPERHD